MSLLWDYILKIDKKKTFFVLNKYSQIKLIPVFKRSNDRPHFGNPKTVLQKFLIGEPCTIWPTIQITITNILSLKYSEKDFAAYSEDHCL